MKWISVEKERPEASQLVLAWGSYDDINNESYKMRVYKCIYDAEENEFECWGPRNSNEGVLPVVTHWMNLPASPDRKEKWLNQCDDIKSVSKLEWISVKDKLPEYETYIATFRRSTCRHDVRTWDADYYTEDSILEGDCFRCPTKMDWYWIQLPEEPEGSSMNQVQGGLTVKIYSPKDTDEMDQR